MWTFSVLCPTQVGPCGYRALSLGFGLKVRLGEGSVRKHLLRNVSLAICEGACLGGRFQGAIQEAVVLRTYVPCHQCYVSL